MVVDPTNILQQAQIEVQAGKVLAVHESPKEPAEIVLTGKTIVPGLVNAHTHLEFSDLDAPIPASSSFAEWIASVIRHRRSQAQSLTSEQLRQARSAAIRGGLTEACASGTAALVDIATQPLDLRNFVEPNEFEERNQLDERLEFDSLQPPKRADREQSLASICALPMLFCLPEVIGLDFERFQQTLRWAQSLPTDFYDQQSSGNESKADRHTAYKRSILRAFGISPHSPYSLMHPLAIDELTKMDVSTLMAMHVAESLDELEWLKFGTGSFCEVYSRVGLPIAQDRVQIEEAIELLSRFQRALLVHGNYLTPTQLSQIAKSTTAIVYCPELIGILSIRAIR
ncbi:MAG: amidohydrolase family protein [Pirellulales bacterium]